MNIAGPRSIGSAVLLVLLSGAGCNRPKRASSESSAAPTPQGIRASITARAPDAFYDPPSDLPHHPGALLRSEPLKDVILPAGIRGWRILYATTVDDTHASDGGRDCVRADRSSRRPTSCHRMGARYDGPAAEMHAVALIDVH